MGKLAGAVGLSGRGDDSNRRDKSIYAARNPYWRCEAVLYVSSFESQWANAVMFLVRKVNYRSPFMIVRIKKVSLDKWKYVLN